MRVERSRDGFTTLEAVIALALISIVAGLLFASASGLVRASGRDRSRALAVAKLYRLDDCLRNSALRVRIPYWAPGVEAESLPDGAAFPYCDGERDAIIEVRGADGALLVRTPDASYRFDGVLDVAVSTARDSAGIPVGLRVAFSLEGRHFEVLARFGAAAAAVRSRS